MWNYVAEWPRLGDLRNAAGYRGRQTLRLTLKIAAPGSVAPLPGPSGTDLQGFFRALIAAGPQLRGGVEVAIDVDPSWI